MACHCSLSFLQMWHCRYSHKELDFLMLYWCRYELQTDDSLLEEYQFTYDARWFKDQIQEVFNFWHGSREPEFVTRDERWKCVICKFAPNCPMIAQQWIVDTNKNALIWLELREIFDTNEEPIVVTNFNFNIWNALHSFFHLFFFVLRWRNVTHCYFTIYTSL